MARVEDEVIPLVSAEPYSANDLDPTHEGVSWGGLQIDGICLQFPKPV